MALVCALLSVAACQSIIGLEDHRFTDDGQVDLKSSCDQYCTDAVKHCTAEGVQAYSKDSKDNCLALCEHLPAGTVGATSGNSVSCRAHYAQEAVGGENEQLSCPAAGPGGGSPEQTPACGSNCEAYCGVYKQVCSEASFVDPACELHCPGIFDRGEFSATSDFDGQDDTIQCRLAHLTAAAFYKRRNMDGDRKAHCGHSKLKPTLMNDGTPCDLQPDTAPSCESYCSLVMTACEQTPQYETEGQCLKYCQTELKAEALPKGTTDVDHDTLNCRRWHAYSALFERVSHCPHAGPTGDGHCGDNICKTYCSSLATACGARFKTEFPGDTPAADQCEAQCKTLTGGEVKDLGYSLDKSETRENTLFCRFRNVVKVFENRMSGTGMGMAACDKPGLFPADACTPLP